MLGTPAPFPPMNTRLLSTTIRRTLVLGWRYLAIGSVISVLLAFVLLFGPHGRSVFAQTYPLEIPIFAVTASIGGLMTYASDRTKGVFEYLIAYGVRPRSLFVNGLLSTAALVGVFLALSLAILFGAALAAGVSLSETLLKNLALYSLPMSLAGALFTAIVGMIWASLSTPRAGMNSPVGLAPMVGIAPTVFVLIAAEAAAPDEFYYVTVLSATVIGLAVIGLVAVSAHLMGRERFLSPL